MKILFYMEPWIERKNPLFRLASLQKDFPYSIIGENDDVKLVSGEWAKIYLHEKQTNIDYIFFNEKELRSISKNYLQAQISLYKNKESIENLNKYKQLFQLKLDNWEPDVVITYEGVKQHLEYIYPNAKVLNQEWEMTLRILGMEGFVFNSKDKVLKEPTWNGINFLKIIRKEFIHKIDNFDFAPFYPLKHHSKKTILLPLQGDHFNFQGNTKYLNQFDMILDVLNTVSEEIDILVVEHPSLQGVDLTQDNINYLRKAYHNFIFIEESRSLNSASTYAMKYVDAVATVSSSLMSQAMLYRKAVIQIGDKENEIGLPNLMDFVSSDNLEYKLADNYDVDKYLINKIFYRTHMRNKISKEHILNNLETPIYDYFEWNKILNKF